MNKGFCTKLCGDLDFEGMVIDICYDDQRIASINYDEGMDNLEIEIFTGKEHAPRQAFPLQEFLKILEKAKTLAIQCATEDFLREQK